ncbi:hypothetical protein T492DRAFT_1119414 [Pavlovales sp. CCMP2436]|nr:hypothetical protein T492DRAFT_1119414 [Pavlovales sp. CCMP2436]
MTPTKWAQLLAVSLCSVAQTCAAVSEAHGLHRVVPAWPGKPYNFACPLHTPPEVCARIGKFGELSCAEPESETEEIVTAFLLNCENCTYVDIGCNLGTAALIPTCYPDTPRTWPS